jgi:hypothetical protein
LLSNLVDWVTVDFVGLRGDSLLLVVHGFRPERGISLTAAALPRTRYACRASGSAGSTRSHAPAVGRP